MFNAMIEVLKANPRKIVFTEGPDPRILEATDRLKKGGFLTPILIGEVEAVKAAAAKAGNFDVEGVEIIDPATYPEMDAMVEKMVALRKGKMTAEDCRKALSKGNYFGTMLVKMGYADALLGGATYSTADTVRPALQLVKTKAGRSPGVLLLHPGPWARKSWPWATAPSTLTIRTPWTRTATWSSPLLRSWRRWPLRRPRTAKVFGIDPEGRHAELLHQGLRQGRHRGS